MIKFFLTLITALLLSIPGLAQETSYTASIPLVEDGLEIGDVDAEIKNEKIIWLDRSSLIKILGPKLQPDTLKSLEKLPEKISPSLLPFPLKFNPQKFVIETQLKVEFKATQKTNLGLDLSEEASEALQPSPFGGAINYNLEKNWADPEFGGNAFNGQFNSFINLHSVVLEGQSFYQDNRDHKKWFRGDTRLVKDFQKSQVRSQLGDVYPSVQGFMVGRPLGGINIQRNFALNPYRLPYPTGRQDFSLKSRSLVRYFVNSVLIKSEYLPAGNYSAKDIPLNNGLNTIVIEATDELGQKQIFTFRTSSSIGLLNEGETRFDMSYGTPFQDTGVKRDYIDSEGKLFSGFFQYGFSRTFSSSVYLQNQLQFNLSGLELIKATPVGNFSMGHAQSKQGELTGNAQSLGYQLITQGEKWFDSNTLNLRYENRSDDFRASLLENSSSVKNFYSVTYTVPLSNLLTFSAGGNYGDVRNNSLNDRYGIDTNVSIRIFKDHSLSAFISRNRDEFKQWNDVGYVFLTFTFPETNNYFSAFYDDEQKSTRLTYLKDNQNRLRTFRTQVTAEEGEKNRFGELDVLYPTTFAVLGGRFNGMKDLEKNNSSLKGGLRLNSAFVFAYQDGEMGAGLSRPVPGSFVIFKPEKALKGQQISLKSTSPYNEASTGPFNEITFSNLLAYQYRDIQLDPTMMDEGRSLIREKFVLYPTYRSAHLIKLHERGSVSISGKLLNADGSPAVLQVGYVGTTPFFTNRNGEFFIEGIGPGSHDLKLDGRDEKLPVNIDKNKRGLLNIGQLQFKDDL